MYIPVTPDAPAMASVASPPNRENMWAVAGTGGRRGGAPMQSLTNQPPKSLLDLKTFTMPANGVQPQFAPASMRASPAGDNGAPVTIAQRFGFARTAPKTLKSDLSAFGFDGVPAQQQQTPSRVYNRETLFKLKADGANVDVSIQMAIDEFNRLLMAQAE